MKEILPILLQAVLLAVVPVCSAFLVQGIRALARYASTKMDNALAKKYLEDAASAITTAVSHTNQTYVDTLKKSDKFTKENQEEALSKAIREAVNLMQHETIAFLKEAYGDMNDYLVSQIEAEVRKQKLAEPLTLGAPVEAVMEVRENPDPVAVATAAASAAATAATAQVARTAALEAKPAATEAGNEKPEQPAAPDVPHE